MTDKRPCGYCPNLATQNLVWLKPERTVVPYCGSCNFEAAIQKLLPATKPLHEGIDYVIEAVIPPLPRTSGDGIQVVVEVDRSWVRETGKTVSIVMPKLEARKLSKEIMEASQRAEPDCDDATDHWRGHCGCK